MVVAKENAAAHAFAKHIESLQLPSSFEEKFGRLVGVTELEKGPASKTRLDVPPGFRNDVLRGKQVIIGCGGGFHQECSQPYSPVAKWMREVDLALNDDCTGSPQRACCLVWGSQANARGTAQE